MVESYHLPASSFEARCGDPTGLSVLLHNMGVIARVVPNLINCQECFTVNCTGGILIRYSYPYFTREEIDAVRLPTVTQLARGGSWDSDPPGSS